MAEKHDAGRKLMAEGKLWRKEDDDVRRMLAQEDDGGRQMMSEGR